MLSVVTNDINYRNPCNICVLGNGDDTGFCPKDMRPESVREQVDQVRHGQEKLD